MAGESYNFIVDWGDSTSSTITSATDAAATHTYAAPGRYWITITGTISAFSFEGTGGSKDPRKLIDVHQWGSLALGNTGGYFNGASNMNFSAADAPDLASTTNFNSAFQSASTFNSPLNHWNVGNVTSMYGTFGGATAFNQPLSAWNTGNVTNMGLMFHGAAAFNQDISAWNVSNVTDMLWMFFGATSFNQNISTWDVLNVMNFSNMFESANAFNQDVGGWDINPGPGVNLGAMFHGATSFNQDISDWDVSGVSLLGYMFANATAFNQDLGEWTVSSATDMDRMFDGSGLSRANYDSLLNAWSAKTLPMGLVFGAETTAYSSAGAASRATLAGTKGWTVSDLGLVSAQGAGPDPVLPVTRVGQESAESTITFTNNGAIDISFSSPGVMVTGPQAASFSLTSNTCAANTIAGGASCSVGVKFAPRSAGIATASVVFTPSNPATRSPSTVSVALSAQTPPMAIVPAARAVTLTIDANGGSCSVAAIAGYATAWVPLPAVADCQKTDSMLAGWRPSRSSMVFAPGAAVLLSNDNTIEAVWRSVDVSGSQTTVTSQPTSSASSRPGKVVWNRTGTVVRSGDPGTLTGRNPRFVITAQDPMRVKPATIAAAKRLASRYGGSYEGLVVSSMWRSPRIVATPSIG